MLTPNLPFAIVVILFSICGILTNCSSPVLSKNFNRFELKVTYGRFFFVEIFLAPYSLFLDKKKSSEELDEEKEILQKMLDVVEQRDELVALLEEQRIK